MRALEKSVEVVLRNTELPVNEPQAIFDERQLRVDRLMVPIYLPAFAIKFAAAMNPDYMISL